MSSAGLPRQLTDRERAVIERLLTSVRFDGAADYLAQLPMVRVTELCSCGCPTIYLKVVKIDREAATPGPQRMPHEALPVQGRYEGDEYDVILFQAEGRLSCLELAFPDPERPPAEFPPADEMGVWTPEGPDAWWRQR